MAETLAGVTIRDAVAGAAAILHDAGCESPRLDAELLLAESLGVTRARLVLDAPEAVPEEVLARFDSLVARRRGREPVAYILGLQAFRWITLAVDRRVLVPRPETELLVEVGIALPQGLRVLDLGTGSGAVALALKHERPDLEVWGADVSPDALAVARTNATRLGLDVTFCLSDLMAGAPARCDAILANLPYVAEGASLPPDVVAHEPAAALWGGPDGLSVVRRLAGQLAEVPFVALEVGQGQARAVDGLLRAGGFSAIACRKDLAGIERVVVGSRR